MPNYDQPVSSGLEAAEAMRALAHATLNLVDKPEDTFSVLGDMLSITSSYVSILDNLAHAHERKIGDAHDDQDRDLVAGRELALAAAQSLRRASFQIADTYRHVDHATDMSSQIVWFPPAAAPVASDRARRVGPTSTVAREPGTSGRSSPAPPAPPAPPARPSRSRTAAVPQGRSL